MTTWEYVTTPLMIHNTAAILNNWGSDGWELVQIVTNEQGGIVAYMKRPLQGSEPAAAAASAAAAAGSWNSEPGAGAGAEGAQ
ncbi:DUF4177 domain-containing protein [Subtercola sp. PAMC28395]|uniref:DUF4177 domain-containing protein n=1 Tax=Subtercola sp. PAMC28395 TaxID=2846775 RepID=UPI001C0D3D4D|nr:DUF4177 domain-containing protein [Subtercola sp. PAMC28395]QWT24914.1 DUF4177 domain-containing protein [Subtercola sp. PAMC28395]